MKLLYTKLILILLYILLALYSRPSCHSLCTYLCLKLHVLHIPTVSHLYGFGLMDAEAMVKEAERWKQVPQQHICVENADRQIR